MTFRNLTLERQRRVGIVDLDNSLVIDGLTSRNAVPALRIDGRGSVALVRGRLAAERKVRQPAIEVEHGATLHMVDTIIRNYANSTTKPGEVALGPDAARSLVVTEGTIHTDIPAFDLPPAQALDTPDLPPDRWAKVDGFTGAAIMTALGSGAPIIYLPFGQYLISKPVVIPASVRRIISFASKLKLAPHYPTDMPVLIVDTRRRTSLMIEGLDATANGPRSQPVWIKNDSSANLLIRDCMFAGVGYRGHGSNLPDPHGAPNIFLENLAAGKFDFIRQNAVAWQLNPESDGTKVRNEDGQLTIYGLKTEGTGAILSTAGGQTTVFGGLIYVNKETRLTFPPSMSSAAEYASRLSRSHTCPRTAA